VVGTDRSAPSVQRRARSIASARQAVAQRVKVSNILTASIMFEKVSAAGGSGSEGFGSGGNFGVSMPTANQ
jgi:hypothetical protein